MMDEGKKREIELALMDLEQALRSSKPNDRSDLDRSCAVAITEFEKLKAYIDVYVLETGK